MKNVKQAARGRALAVTLTFLILLGGLAITNAFWPKKTFSENENRVLESFPKLSWENLIQGKFTEGFDTYITDHFAFRDVWVGAKTMTELALFKKDSGGVYFAKDGYLIEQFDQVDEAQYRKNLEAVRDFSEAIKTRFGLTVRTMLVPTASHTLREKLPAFAPEISQDALIEQAMALLPGFVDVRGALERHSGEEIYYRTDHHWTNLGVCYAYQAFCEAAGLSVHPVSWYRQEVLSTSFLGTTYSKASLYTVRPDTITAFYPGEPVSVQVDYNQGKKITDTLYETSHLDTKDKYSVFLDGNQPITKITTSNKNGRRLLLIKDSYANSFATFAADDYEQVILVDLRHYRAPLSALVESAGVNEILILYNLKGFSSDVNLALMNL